MTKEEIQQMQANKRKYMPLIQAAEFQNQLPENFLAQLIQQESAFTEDVVSGKRVSSAGAKGIAQFMPDTATEWAKRLGIPDEQKWTPEAQIKMAGGLLGHLLKQYKSNPNPNISENAATFAYAEYNAGGTYIKKALALAASGKEFISALPKETQGYVQAVRNWTGDVTDTDRFNKPYSATAKIFKNFDKLETNIAGLRKLPAAKTKVMADYLLSIHLGKS